MAGLDAQRVALVVARDAGDGPTAGHEEDVATGYFLTGDLVLTARHVADRQGCVFEVRAEIGESEEDRWSLAKPVWMGVGDVDAMLLRTIRKFGDWPRPGWATLEGGTWKSIGYPRISADDAHGRKTLPLGGSFDLSLGQGPPELALQTEQHIAAEWDTHWKGVSGAPVFSTDAAGGGLTGIIVEAHRALANGLVGLPIGRLLEDIHFRSTTAPSFLGPLPSTPWCLVLTAEGTTSDLVEDVGGVLAGFREEEVRFRDLDVTPIKIPVVTAIESVESWAATVDALARADFVIADVTSFEPAVMVLLGVRSVVRRGVSISVTAGDLASHATSLPFNIQETRVLSYDDNFYDDLHLAMAEGASNLAQDANYLDLPAYNGVRAPRPETWAEDDAKNMLVLCPFGAAYSEFFKKLLPIIRGHTKNRKPLRMLDLRSPRLVGQALYEQIRWSSRCLVDWTRWRPNVFFELGVRLACSEHDPLNIIDRVSLKGLGTGLKQYRLLCDLLQPVAYDRANPRKALKPALESWSDIGPAGTGMTVSERALPRTATFSIAQASFVWGHDPMLTPPHVELRQGAERGLGKDQERRPERLVLFGDNGQFDSALRDAVMEKWIAAWLYLRHLQAVDGVSSDESKTEFITVSRLVEHALSSSKDPRHVSLRTEIRELLKAERTRRRAEEPRNRRG